MGLTWDSWLAVAAAALLLPLTAVLSVAGPAWRSRTPGAWRPNRLALAAMALSLACVGGGAAYLLLAQQARLAPAVTAAPEVPPPASDKPGHALTPEQLERMVAEARERTQKDPKDATGWALLAHSYDMLGRFEESSQAYAKLVPLVPGDAQVLADYADALAVARGRTLEGEPRALVDKALAIDPKNVKALMLAGTADFERQRYAEAIGYWERARAGTNDERIVRQLEEGLAEARSLVTGASAATAAARASAEAATPASASPGAAVAGRVSLADGLRGKAPPEATVFIFARPAQGSRMPVALLRKRVRDLPLDFVLDDSTAMVPQSPLSKVPEVVVVARVSMHGDVMPQAGDLQAVSAPVALGARGIALTISEVLK